MKDQWMENIIAYMLIVCTGDKFQLSTQFFQSWQFLIKEFGVEK